MSKKSFLTEFDSKFAKREFNIRETLQQIQINLTIYWTWGVRRIVNMRDKGLLLSVNGNLHKGFVLITLEFDDTYTIHFLNKQYNVSKEAKSNIYCDELQSTIDEVIEKINTYSF